MALSLVAVSPVAGELMSYYGFPLMVGGVLADARLPTGLRSIDPQFGMLYLQRMLGSQFYCSA